MKRAPENCDERGKLNVKAKKTLNIIVTKPLEDGSQRQKFIPQLQYSDKTWAFSSSKNYS